MYNKTGYHFNREGGTCLQRLIASPLNVCKKGGKVKNVNFMQGKPFPLLWESKKQNQMIIS